MFAEAAFGLGSSSLVEEAARAVRACGTLLHTGVPIGAQNACCAQRHRALVPPGVPVIPMLPLEEALIALAAQREAGWRTAVLVSGDAGVYSLLHVLVQCLGRDALRVFPGVSALQAFFAAMKRPWQEARVLSAHGRAIRIGCGRCLRAAVLPMRA